MSDEATRRVMSRVAADVERKRNCVRAMRDADHCPPADLVEDLRADVEFLQYLNEVINAP
jgi:hypothetical protein